MKAIADDFATIGVMIMGESDESIPVVIIRGAQMKRTERDLTWRDMTIEPSQDIYMRNIAYEFSR
jgi:F420-0:gamma-glutamyl ligase